MLLVARTAAENLTEEDSDITEVWHGKLAHTHFLWNTIWQSHTHRSWLRWLFEGKLLLYEHAVHTTVHRPLIYVALFYQMTDPVLI